MGSRLATQGSRARDSYPANAGSAPPAAAPPTVLQRLGEVEQFNRDLHDSSTALEARIARLESVMGLN